MPAPLPPRPLGLTFGTASNPKVLLEVYNDFCCPFSTRLYHRITSEVVPYYMRTAPDALKVVMYHLPQPWHPQSAMMHEAALAVDIVKPIAYPAMWAKLFENREAFTDSETYDMSRADIYVALAKLATECGVDEEAFLKTLMLNTSGGQKNGGNGATGALKLAVKHARQRGIHVSPTCAVNGVVCDTSSGWTLDQWKDFLNPLISWEHAAAVETEAHKDHEIKLTIRSLLPKVGGLSDDKLADFEVNALFDDKMKTAMGLASDSECKVLKYASQIVAGKMFFVKVEILSATGAVLDIVHVRIYKPLPHTGNPPVLQGVLGGRTLDDEIEYFQGGN